MTKNQMHLTQIDSLVKCGFVFYKSSIFKLHDDKKDRLYLGHDDFKLI